MRDGGYLLQSGAWWESTAGIVSVLLECDWDLWKKEKDIPDILSGLGWAGKPLGEHRERWRRQLASRFYLHLELPGTVSLLRCDYAVHLLSSALWVFQTLLSKMPKCVLPTLALCPCCKSYDSCPSASMCSTLQTDTNGLSWELLDSL